MTSEATLLYHYVAGIQPPAQFEDFYRRGVALEESRLPQKSFSAYLARTASQNRILLAIIDVWTRLFDRQNLLRHRLNAVVAFAEINPESMARLERGNENVFTRRLKLAGWLSVYLCYFVAAFPLAGILYLIWRITKK